MKTAYTFATRLALLSSSVAFLLMFAFADASSADETEQDSPNIEGVWQLRGQIGEDGEVTELTGQQAEALILKIISDGRWSVTYTDPTTGSIRMHHGGTYTLEGAQYTENVEYASETTRTLVDRSFKFNVDVEGDSLSQKGIGNPYNEVWERARKKPSAGGK